MAVNYKTPPIAIVGDSGTGKSTASRTLPKDRTVIINTEVKMMPYEDHSAFKVMDVDSYNDLNNLLTLLESEDGEKAFDYVVLDSFTSMTEFIERWSVAMFAGFTQWKEYNLAITKVINILKRLPQQVFVIGIPEQKDESMGNAKQYLKVKGKELKYGIEKEFSIVMFTNPIYSEDTGEMESVEMMFKPNKFNTAKSPVGLFDKRPSNDMLAIAQRVKEFYKVQ